MHGDARRPWQLGPLNGHLTPLGSRGVGIIRQHGSAMALRYGRADAEVQEPWRRGQVSDLLARFRARGNGLE